MHKGDVVEGTIAELRFPNKGLLRVGEGPSCVEIQVKDTLPGQRVAARITRKRSGHYEAALLAVLEPSPAEIPSPCPKFGICGGCQYQSLPPKEELRLKEEQMRELLAGADPDVDRWYEGILESPVTEGYRNRMELTFGDDRKDGPLTLGMHRRSSFYDVVDADACRIVDGDFRKIIRASRDFWAGTGVPFYHRLRREGYLRHLIIRKGRKTGQILIDLVTTGQTDALPAGETATARPEETARECELPVPEVRADALSDPSGQLPGQKFLFDETVTRGRVLLEDFAAVLLSLDLDGTICGILHTRNDSIADIVEDQGTEILYGKSSFEEELLGLTFTVTPFSFFQTNSAGAELLYETARAYIMQTKPQEVRKSPDDICCLPAEEGSSVLCTGENLPETAAAGRKPVIFDLYCGTGTISLLMAPAASKVIGVEIVEEAVLAARENARRNGISNCEFIAGDVLKVIDAIEEKPDLIILDPPRDGVHPKALPKILRYGVPYILYISCKPTSLARDLPLMRDWGYAPLRGVSINQFPRTANVETVVLMSNEKSKPGSYIDLMMDVSDIRRRTAGESPDR